MKRKCIEFGLVGILCVMLVFEIAQYRSTYHTWRDESGFLHIGDFKSQKVSVMGRTYFVDCKGRVRTGEYKDGLYWMYLHEDGTFAKNMEFNGYIYDERGFRVDVPESRWDSTRAPQEVHEKVAYVISSCMTQLERLNAVVQTCKGESDEFVYYVADWAGLDVNDRLEVNVHGTVYTVNAKEGTYE